MTDWLRTQDERQAEVDLWRRSARTWSRIALLWRDKARDAEKRLSVQEQTEPPRGNSRQPDASEASEAQDRPSGGTGAAKSTPTVNTPTSSG